MKNKTVLLFFLLSLCAQITFAWGSTAHRAIAEIAYQNLNKKAQKEIVNLLGDDYLPIFANWADEIKSDQGTLKKYGKIPHYINIKENESFNPALKHNYSIYDAYQEQLSILKDTNKSKNERSTALKLIIHFIGDTHQPLHCGRPDDRGGNDIKVTWFGEETNLHYVWDSGLIDYTKLSYYELAIFTEHNSNVDSESLHSTDPILWINESKKIADEIYASIGDGKLYYPYPYKYLDTVYNQIEKAGIRLAAVLNTIFE